LVGVYLDDYAVVDHWLVLALVFSCVVGMDGVSHVC
jgi:hypothetical protein